MMILKTDDEAFDETDSKVKDDYSDSWQTVMNCILEKYFRNQLKTHKYFRTDAAKLRLPLGPPISSLSQGIRSSMDHKVSVNICLLCIGFTSSEEAKTVIE